MNCLALLVDKLCDTSSFSSLVRTAFRSSVVAPKTGSGAYGKFLASFAMRAFLLALPPVLAVSAQAQTATVNWTDVHQVIDGFGAADAGQSGSMSAANQALFFGTGSGQIGLSILRVSVTDNGGSPGDCSSVSASCAGPFASDMQAAVANGAKIYASPWSPPAAYTTNQSTVCNAGSGNGSLSTGSYAAYATWLANFVKSLQTEDGISLYAISVQNEPDMCVGYDSDLWSGSQIDAFISNNLGPTFASDGLSTLIFEPEGSTYSAMTNLGATCGTDSSCTQYVGGYNWHEYGATLSGVDTVTPNPYPSGWATGKKYWETEGSCGNDFGPSFCESGFNTDINDALGWAALVDQRIAVDGANAWLYWWLVEANPSDDESLSDGGSNIAKRAYMLGQYSKFVRPGFYRIDATHQPQSGVSVSAYQNKSNNTLVIIATNYTGSAVSQAFNITNAPSFSTLTPTTTSASLSLAAQSNVSVSNNSFTYSLPANSITTFVSGASGPPPPSNLSGTVVQ